MDLTESTEECFKLSIHAVAGVEEVQLVRLWVLAGNQIMLILVDSDSTHSFVHRQFVNRTNLELQSIPVVIVKVTNREKLQCDRIDWIGGFSALLLVLICKWWIWGHMMLCRVWIGSNHLVPWIGTGWTRLCHVSTRGNMSIFKVWRPNAKQHYKSFHQSNYRNGAPAMRYGQLQL